MSKDEYGTRRAHKLRRPKPALITDASRSPLENWEHRKRVYNWIQFSRVPFLLAAGATFMIWENWILATILFVISVPLPGIAVVIANGAGEPKDERTKQVYKPQVARERRQHQEQQAQQLMQSHNPALEAHRPTTPERPDPPKPPPTIIDHE